MYNMRPNTQHALKKHNLRVLVEISNNSELQKIFNLPPCKISSFQIFLKILRIKAQIKLQNIQIMSLKISLLFLVPADLALICWL